MNSNRDTRFDSIFLGAIQQAGSPEKFFDNLFGFIAAKSDLFTQPDYTKKMVNTHMNMHCDAFQKSKAAQEMVKEQQRIQLEKMKAEKEAAEKKSKYYMAEKLKMENEKRAKQGLPPLMDPEEEKAQAAARAAQKKEESGAQVEEVTDEQAEKIEKE